MFITVANFLVIALVEIVSMTRVPGVLKKLKGNFHSYFVNVESIFNALLSVPKAQTM